ncbi:glycosyltransferase family 4 protein [Bradyrhizobium lablabi]|uniref:glycosyltransferase family 4 protein n=1 Tax=Bradyrhizobium lablabi TaxID=722472 RepID=UPI00090AB9B6|nr:glycosyltransferase family 4 protein [Bradyrhizobium lablabi]SHM85883.1 Glycosyltransferase involved in cell wall bisynthesis [Bradyrhizobium lablabi]
MVRIFYAAGPGHLISAHKKWREGVADPNLTALTYSSQFADFCRSIGAKVYMVSHDKSKGLYRDENFVVGQVPKRNFGRSGLGYHCSQITYGLWLLLAALRFRANFAVIHSSSTHFFLLTFFRLFGIKVIPVLHNTLWPAGFPQKTIAKNIIRRLDGMFFRHCTHAIIAVSPECLRQVTAITGTSISNRLIDMRGQFARSYFAAVPAPPAEMRPFRIMFSGRITENKGVFDLVNIAKIVEAAEPGLVRWEICGSGPDLIELTRQRDAAGLKEIFEIHGHVYPPEMSKIIGRSHAAIVPTKSTFEEGMALSAVEAVLSNRPVITSQVVPAHEVLGDACIIARTDDVHSYADQVLWLARSPDFYRAACNACHSVKEPFLDGKIGFASGLRTAFSLK